MTSHSIPNRRSMKCVVDRNSGKIGLGLCVAILLLGGGQAESVTQTGTANPGFRNVQSGGPMSDNPAHGRRIAQTKCAACHGADGNSSDPRFPKLAGQEPSYIYRQLRAFAHGERVSDIMSANAATLSYADMADVARFYSRQAPRPDGVTGRRLATIGESVYFSGMPSCAMCHGSARRQGMPMMGMMGPGMMRGGMTNGPNLNGQHAAYIVDQLNRFATGERHGTVMNRIAARLSDANKQAVAEYLSSQP